MSLSFEWKLNQNLMNQSLSLFVDHDHDYALYLCLLSMMPIPPMHLNQQLPDLRALDRRAKHGENLEHRGERHAAGDRVGRVRLGLDLRAATAHESEGVNHIYIHQKHSRLNEKGKRRMSK